MIENLYPIKIIEKHAAYALVLGIAYAIIGIGVAVLLFPEDPAIVAVAVIALMFYPTITKLMRAEEHEESKNRRFNLLDFFRNHQYIFQVYLLFFLGVMLVFAFFSIVLPTLAVNHILKNQIEILYGVTGNAIFSKSLFTSIFTNNFWVMMVIFATSFFLGEAGIFLITWNASVWGTIFGLFAKNYALHVSQNPAYAFFLVMGIVITHTILEAFAYISAANAGGIISRGLVSERFGSPKFQRVLSGTIITLLFAIVVLFIAVSVETYVLGNIHIYQEIVRYSFIK